MAKKSRTYIWQFVIGLGFLSGLWTAVGIDPQAVIVGFVGNIVDMVFSDPAIRTLFLFLPMILLFLSIWSAYKKGRFIGLISVMVAYFAGLVILVSTMMALILLGIAIAIGFLAPVRCRKKH
jgi:hypothetical protein